MSYGTEYPCEVEHDEVPEQERLRDLALEAIRDSTADVADEEEVAELPDWGSYEPPESGRAGPPSEVEEEAAKLLAETYTAEAGRRRG